MIKSWSDDAWKEYMYWHDQNDRSVIRKINQLILSIDRTPFDGLGKPEALRNELAGLWSRRITQEHRLVYRIRNNEIQIVSCRYHY